MQAKQILDGVIAGKRLTDEEALFLLKEGDWTEMANAANQVRNQKHDPETVTYTVYRVVNYTNICNVECSFCSFMDEVESDRGYTLSLEDISAKAVEAQKHGADQMFIQGGVNPNLPLEYYTDALKLLSQDFGMHVRGFSPVELLRLAEKLELPLKTLIEKLKEAGLGSVPGAGAEILTENMREKLSPKKLSAQDWCDVMGACHEADLPGSANIVFGSTEDPEDIVQHFGFIREQQDKTGGFLTFVPWTFQPQTKNFVVKHVAGWDYLKVLALSRLYFDNIENIEVSVLVLGKELAEMGLKCGANDINSIVIEENVLASKGLKTIRAAERFIKEAGFTPKRRALNFDKEYTEA